MFTFDKEQSKEINANGKKEAFHKMGMVHSYVTLALNVFVFLQVDVYCSMTIWHILVLCFCVNGIDNRKEKPQ